MFCYGFRKTPHIISPSRSVLIPTQRTYIMIFAKSLVQISRFRLRGIKAGELPAIFSPHVKVKDSHDDHIEDWDELSADQIGREPAIRSKKHERELWSLVSSITLILKVRLGRKRYRSNQFHASCGSIVPKELSCRTLSTPVKGSECVQR